MEFSRVSSSKVWPENTSFNAMVGEQICCAETVDIYEKFVTMRTRWVTVICVLSYEMLFHVAIQYEFTVGMNVTRYYGRFDPKFK